MIIEAVILAVSLSSVVSYETTGKGLADHTISRMSEKDCKLARVIHNEQVCQTEPQGSVTVTSAVPTRTVSVGSGSVDRANDVFAERARKYNEGNKTR